MARVAKVIRPDAGAGIFETLLVLAGRPAALGAHLQRLASSAGALYGADLDVAQSGKLATTARSIAHDLQGPHRLRILATPVRPGEVSIRFEAEPAPAAFDGSLGSPVRLVPTVISGGLGPHKWLDRSILDKRRAELGLEASSHLLVTDTSGAVLETERASVVVLLDGALVSPSPDGRLLAGVTVVTAFGAADRLGVQAAFGPLTVADLERAGEVFCLSAVRGITPARLSGGPAAGAGPLVAERSPADERGGIAARLATALFESWRSC
jgi:branched-subunit amino acid aminotransferase/4-amino-4-deoxychorismate lyase